MARNKMEKEFSEKLNQREIKPSAAAWDRLDAMLAAAESQPQTAKISRNFKWLYVAASFLGFVLIGTLFFRQADAKSVNVEKRSEQVVEATKNTQKPASQVQIATQPEAQIAEASAEKTASKEMAEKPTGRLKIAKLNSASEPKAQLADNSIITRVEKQTGESSRASSNPIIINQKTDKSNHANSEVASASAEELLSAAQAKRESGATGAKVNARSLLSQVDSQAEEKLTLKQKAVRALNKNYQQVKVAVENRNVEENH